MALLTEAQRLQVWRGLQRWWSANYEELPNIVKQDLKDGVDSTDVYIESIQAAFNNSLPTVLKTNLSLEQKTVLFCAVAARRVSKEFALLLFGEVD